MNLYDFDMEDTSQGEVQDQELTLSPAVILEGEDDDQEVSNFINEGGQGWSC